MAVGPIFAVAYLLVAAVWLGVSPVAEAMVQIAVCIGAAIRIGLAALSAFVVGKAGLIGVVTSPIIIAASDVRVFWEAGALVGIAEVVCRAVLLAFAGLEAFAVQLDTALSRTAFGISFAGLIPWARVTRFIFPRAVPAAVFRVTTHRLIERAALVVEACWVTLTDRWFACVGGAVFRLNHVACGSVAITVTGGKVIVAAVVGGNTEVATPSVTAQCLAIRTFGRRTRFGRWMTEWTIVSKADLLCIPAIWLLRTAVVLATLVGEDAEVAVSIGCWACLHIVWAAGVRTGFRGVVAEGPFMTVTDLLVFGTLRP